MGIRQRRRSCDLCGPRLRTTTNVFGFDYKRGGSGSATVNTASIQNGAPPYTYWWRPASGTEFRATGLLPGIYDVTVTDDGAIAGTYTVTIADANACTYTRLATLVAAPLLFKVVPLPPT